MKSFALKPVSLPRKIFRFSNKLAVRCTKFDAGTFICTHARYRFIFRLNTLVRYFSDCFIMRLRDAQKNRDKPRGCVRRNTGGPKKRGAMRSVTIVAVEWSAGGRQGPGGRWGMGTARAVAAMRRGGRLLQGDCRRVTHRSEPGTQRATGQKESLARGGASRGRARGVGEGRERDSPVSSSLGSFSRPALVIHDTSARCHPWPRLAVSTHDRLQ